MDWLNLRDYVSFSSALDETKVTDSSTPQKYVNSLSPSTIHLKSHDYFYAIVAGIL